MNGEANFNDLYYYTFVLLMMISCSLLHFFVAIYDTIHFNLSKSHLNYLARRKAKFKTSLEYLTTNLLDMVGMGTWHPISA